MADHWNGVRWGRVADGVCVIHGDPVGPVTRLCLACHRAQLAAARAGSREWERRWRPTAPATLPA